MLALLWANILEFTHAQSCGEDLMRKFARLALMATLAIVGIGQIAAAKSQAVVNHDSGQQIAQTLAVVNAEAGITTAGIQPAS